MLKKVKAEDLRIGMFVDKAEGPWSGGRQARRTSKVLDRRSLRYLQGGGAGAGEFWIDTSKGDDAEIDPATVEPPSPPAQRSHELRDEFKNAIQICDKARTAVVAAFDDARHGHAPDVAGAMPVIDDMMASITRHAGAMLSMIRLKSADDYTYMHSVSVCALMVALGRELHLDDDECRSAGLGGLFHDIGKAFVPTDILDKPGKLTDDEFTTVRKHPMLGSTLLRENTFHDPVAVDVCLHHHEKIDGTGYPHGLAAADISLHARMAAVCDVYDAITSARSYKKAWDPAESLARMAGWQGHFDRSILATFIRLVGVYPPGSLVRLASDRLAVVVEHRQHALYAPLVNVFHSMKTQTALTPTLVDLAAPDAADHIAGREPREGWNAAYLESLWRP